MKDFESRYQYHLSHNQRKGQAVFNAIYDINPEFVNIYIRGTIYDCFYDSCKATRVIELYNIYLEKGIDCFEEEIEWGIK